MDKIFKDNICERCQNETTIWKMSWFNEDHICPNCQIEESKHPLFQQAKEIERREFMKGNYKGIFGDLTWEEIKYKDDIF